jgi:hypothetical protein
MSGELTTHALQSSNSGNDGERVYVAIHHGKNVEKTLTLVALVYHFKYNFYNGPVRDIADEIDPDIDTNCRILPSDQYNPLKPGYRIFDLACAYAPEKLVNAMMRHPDTPVGEVHGRSLGRHSALTFLAQIIAGWDKIKSHPHFEEYPTSRRSIFKRLIEDPRTPVNYRIDTMDGGEMLDVLGILKRHDGAKGLAFYPIVSELLWQRRATIATHRDFKDEMYAAFTAATTELLKDRYFRHMRQEDRQGFQDALQQDIDNQYGRCSLRARLESQGHGLGPKPLTWDRIDQRSITQDTTAINSEEAVY